MDGRRTVDDAERSIAIDGNSIMREESELAVFWRNRRSGGFESRRNQLPYRLGLWVVGHDLGMPARNQFEINRAALRGDGRMEGLAIKWKALDASVIPMFQQVAIFRDGFVDHPVGGNCRRS